LIKKLEEALLAKEKQAKPRPQSQDGKKSPRFMQTKAKFPTGLKLEEWEI